MKKVMKTLCGLLVAVALTFVFTANSFAAADFTCPKMEPSVININSAWLKNVSGVACGTLADGASRYFLLNPINKDPMLAVLLTALSLQKNLYVHSVADLGNGDVVDVVALMK